MKNFISKLKTIWLSFSKKVVRVNTAVLLSLVYVVVIGFMALIVKLLRKDFLQKKINSTQASYWQTRITSEQTLDRSKYQF